MNSAEDGLPLPQRYWAILNLGVGLALSVLDSSIANIALPAIAKELHASPAEFDLGHQRLSARDHHRSAAVGLARRHLRLPPHLYRRAGGVHRRRVGQRPFAILVDADPRARAARARRRRDDGRQHGFGAVHLPAAATGPRHRDGFGLVSISSAAGPSVAAAILAVASWPWLFASSVPVGLAAILMSLRLLPSNPPSEHRFDLASAVLSAFAFAFLIGGINGVGHHHPASSSCRNSPRRCWSATWSSRQSSLAMPLLPVDLFKRPIFALSVTTAVCTFVAQGIAFVALPFYFRT